MNELNNTVKTESSTVATRRSFLRKAGVTTLVASLPTQSVWGTTCTVSGNMSGNMSSPHATCTLNGRSPGYWHKNSTQIASFTWQDVFGINRAPFGTHTKTGQAIPSSTLVTEFLPWKMNGIKNPIRGPQNINRHLLAAFCNAYHGLYPLTISPYAYAQNLYDEIERVGAGTTASREIKEAIEATYA